MKGMVVEITAECSRHGRFSVTRKPNKPREGRPDNGFYDAVKCLKCPWWATIISQRLVEIQPETTAPANHQAGLF